MEDLGDICTWRGRMRREAKVPAGLPAPGSALGKSTVVKQSHGGSLEFGMHSHWVVSVP